MSGRLNHDKAKRAKKARVYGERDTDKVLPARRSIHGWRTSWPEEFPVTVTRAPVAAAKDAA